MPAGVLLTLLNNDFEANFNRTGDYHQKTAKRFDICNHDKSYIFYD